MKKLFQTTVLGATVALLSLIAARAQDTRWYVKADAGGALTCNTELKEFFGTATPGSKVKFDPGVRFSYGGGYWLTDWFAAEAETGVIANMIHSITGATRDDAVFSNVPFLINARFQCPSTNCIVPYFGGGVGGAASIINIDRIDIGGTAVHGSQADAVFAYQAFGGLRYRINEHINVGLEYHYFATTAPGWDARNISGSMRFGNIDTHTITAAFSYRF